MSDWISVEERLPPDREDVLVHYKNGLMDRAQYAYGAAPWYQDSWYLPGWPCPADEANITHWMPLPTPPTDREEK